MKASDICKKFNVTMETVRRDIEELEIQGYLRKVYGGAIEGRVYGPEPSYNDRMVTRLNEKRSIAKKAIDILSPKEIVYLDGGTTTLEIAKEIRNTELEITVVTNSLPVAEILNSSKKTVVIFLGGTLSKDDMVVADLLNSDQINLFHFQKAIFGAASISSNQGVTDFNLNVATLKRRIMEKSDTLIIAADYSKFNSMIQYTVARYHEINYLVTDDKTDLEEIKKCEDSGICVVVGETKDIE